MNQNIYFICPRNNFPSGGVKQIYKQVDILNANGFNYGKGPATQSLDLLNSRMKEMENDPWFKERSQKNNNK